ncbi:MAG: cytochrome c peroxidase [Pseudomonadota bacterium]
MRNTQTLYWVWVVLLWMPLGIGCSQRVKQDAYQWDLPRGFPIPVVPRDNPMSERKVILGRKLFFDRRLSGNQTYSCASCHKPELAFTDGLRQAIGSTGEKHQFSALSLFNVAYNSSLGWVDANTRTLEDQVHIPLFNENPIELGISGKVGEILGRLRRDSDIVSDFAVAFPNHQQPVSITHIAKAIAAFERTLIAADSAYDRYVYYDDKTVMSESAKRGMGLFFSERLQCSVCHQGFNFSSSVSYQGNENTKPDFHNTGLSGEFRAPTLRNIALTAPYMHDGRFADLLEVIEHYAKGANSDSNTIVSELMVGFELNPTQRNDLVEFLRSLTSLSQRTH